MTLRTVHSEPSLREYLEYVDDLVPNEHTEETL